jgi:hypothetical protein
MGHLTRAGGSVDEDMEITEEPIDEEDVLALGGPDSWDIKKNEGTGG